jgi:ribosomal protein L10
VGGEKKKSEKRIKKEAYWQKLWELTDKYKKAVLVDVDNVSSKQINDIRRSLRPLGAKMIMGKNVSIAFHTSADPHEGSS